MTSSRITLAIGALIALVLVVLIRELGCLGPFPSKTPAINDHRPTIIFVYADDLDCETLFQDWQSKDKFSGSDQEVRFPTIKAMADEGLVFTNFHVTTPVCGPSRACLLSGQYAHRNGVRVNQPGVKASNGFPGGYSVFDPKTEFSNKIRQAGYQTCFVGKYIHEGFQPDTKKGETWQTMRPPGWEIFRASLGAKYLGFRTVNAVTGNVMVIGDQYRTDFEASQVIEILGQWDERHRAQLICWLSLAPHDDSDSSPNSALRHRELYSNSQPPSLGRNTDFRDLNLPNELAAFPDSLSPEYRQEINRLWHARLRAIKALDEGLARIRQRLREQGRLENTIFILSSDHGFRLGEHGHIGKRLPYDRITRVPTIICGPGIKQGTCNELLANIDFAPTLIEMTGAQVSVDDPIRDGRSFARLLNDPDRRLDPTREGLLLEHWETDASFGNRSPATWAAWRTSDRVYTEWATGGRECYDLATDPEQRDNLYSRMTPDEVAGNSGKLRTSRKGNQPPMVAHVVTTTGLDFAEVQNGNFQPVILDGFADSHGGVAKVELELHCPTLGQYWTGNSWSSEASRVTASLGNPGGLMTSWQFPIDTSAFLTNPPSIDSGDESTNNALELTILTIVTDQNGVSSDWAAPQSIHLNFRDPDSWINPLAGTTSRNSPIRLTGRAADETRVQKVRVIINDKVTGKYWNGTEWVTEYQTIDAAITETDDPRLVEWHYEFNLDNDHRVFFGARAVDDDRNFDRTVAWFELGSKSTTSNGD